MAAEAPREIVYHVKICGVCLKRFPELSAGEKQPSYK